MVQPTQIQTQTNRFRVVIYTNTDENDERDYEYRGQTEFSEYAVAREAIMSARMQYRLDTDVMGLTLENINTGMVLMELYCAGALFCAGDSDDEREERERGGENNDDDEDNMGDYN